MKIRFALIVPFLWFATILQAQSTSATSYLIHWRGIEKWVVGNSTIQALSFDSARYPEQNHMPYFVQRIPIDPAYSYEATIVHPTYIALTNEEKAILTGINLLRSTPLLTSAISHLEGNDCLNVSILPFVLQDGIILKLQSFDLQVVKSKQRQKTASSVSRTYATASVLSQGKFVKVRIVNSGVYKLTYEDVVSMGVDPAKVRIFGYGGAVLDQNFSMPKIDDLPEVNIYLNKGSDGVFGSGDYLLFYAQGINKWTYDKTISMFTHTVNPYSTSACYFVTSDAGTGKKIDEKTITVPANATVHPVEEFIDYQVHENETVNLCQSGREFYGEKFNEVTTYTFPFTFPNTISGSQAAVRLDVAANYSTASDFTLDLNGEQATSLTVGKISDSQYEKIVASQDVFPFTPKTDAFNFNLSYSKPTSLATGYLNYLEVNVHRKLSMSGSVMQFQQPGYVGQSTYNQYLLSNANANVQIWDITDACNVNRLSTGIVSGKLSFTDSGNELKRYLAIDPTASSAFQKPEIAGVVPTQNLHGVAQADMVIIAYPEFLTQAETLAQLHRDKDQLTVEVVTPDQIYNEFSSGTPDATAYRWLMKMLYDRALQSNHPAALPKYLLLFGKGSYDNRKLRSDSGSNLILTYQGVNSQDLSASYVTDDYFGFLDDTSGNSDNSDIVRVGIGRFTVTTSQQATDVVAKIIGYVNNQGKGSWKNQLCFVADDDNATLHSTQADNIAETISSQHPSFQTNKIYLDAYTQVINANGQSYPDAKNRFLNLLHSGLFLVNYTGHAAPTGWANEAILTSSDIKSLANTHLPLFVAATCDFVQFDDQLLSAGEEVLFNPTGGGIGILAAARLVYPNQNFTLDKLFCESLFSTKDGEHLRIGDAVASAKNNAGSEYNKLRYVLIGDPALKLNYPTKYQVVTKKVNESTTFGNDTLCALSVATVQGIIADKNGQKVESFNGIVHPVVYDKAQHITTLNNENEGAITYTDRPNTLFSGDAKVINGSYSFSFMLPKDIKYNYGCGRIDYYANDDIHDAEAQGYFENFIIGGADNASKMDTIGPNADLYLNSENFISGDKVNETPLFMAYVKDTNGINTVGSGIGHDVMLTIDQDPYQSCVLNDYFQAGTNSYTNGVVKYKLPFMKDGMHTLAFRVWDLLNNSTTKTIRFQVVNGLTPEIFTISNYPNPAKISTRIVVQHDRPETILNTTVEIVDISGRKIWTFTQSGADNISWNLISNNGQRVKTGIYFYRVSIKTTNSGFTSKTNKLLVVE